MRAFVTFSAARTCSWARASRTCAPSRRGSSRCIDTQAGIRRADHRAGFRYVWRGTWELTWWFTTNRRVPQTWLAPPILGYSNYFPSPCRVRGNTPLVVLQKEDGLKPSNMPPPLSPPPLVTPPAPFSGALGPRSAEEREGAWPRWSCGRRTSSARCGRRRWRRWRRTRWQAGGKRGARNVRDWEAGVQRGEV